MQQNGGTPSGHIRVNGEPLTTKLYDRTCAYVEQFDTLWASLTVRDHLDYAMVGSSLPGVRLVTWTIHPAVTVIGCITWTILAVINLTVF